MKIKFYILPLIFFLCRQAAAQDCSLLVVNYQVTESRCVSTGSILVNATGGSGNYTYRAVGPITTTITSFNDITGLPPGTYSVIVRDQTTGCVKQVDNIVVPGTYEDPRFQLIKSDASCSGTDGTITTINQLYGRSPFTYTIVAPSPSNIGASNISGHFTGLTPGEYSVQLRDSCGGIQVRRITIENYSWWFDSVSVVRSGCVNANVFIRVRDNKGNVNTSGTAFTGFSYGYVENVNDTTWHATNSFTVALGTSRSLRIVVRDNCGQIHSYLWTMPESVKPALNAVVTSNFACSTFQASVTGQNLTSPNFCLNRPDGTIITCNSTGVFTGIPYGSYCIKAIDLCYDTVISRCFTINKPVPSVSASVNITNRNCSTFSATITGQANLFSPDYCLFNSSNVQIACNSTGIFNNIPYGNYCIRTHDACTDSTIERCINVSRTAPAVTSHNINGTACNTFNVSVGGSSSYLPVYCLYDSTGAAVTCDSSGNFSGLPYGRYCVRAISCGDTSASYCFTGSRPVPALGATQFSNSQCSTFTATITGQVNLNSPQYCLYNQSDSLLRCNTTGIFDSLAYGTYCIKVTTLCYDTTLVRCFTQTRPVPSVSATLQRTGGNCTVVTFKVNGTNLTSPEYCLYDNTNMQLACNTTGVFNNYPYGSYCVTVHDNCLDTTMTVCGSFAPRRGLTLNTSKSCNINNAFVDVQFVSGIWPFRIKIYHPNGTELYDTVTNTNPFRIELPALPTGTKYKIKGIDGCGQLDSALINPDANIVNRSITVRAKCPSSVWLNGAGDLQATCSSNFYSVIPQIIKKNGSAFVRSYSSVLVNTFTFADLEPAQYIIEYTQQTCNTRVYDTVQVAPYAYPSGGQSAIYQCDNNNFSLGADVIGGVSPYSFEIIGSLPSTPSIVSAPQNSPVFNINTGTVYSLIRLRTIDACGNATLSDVSVLPFQNITMNASATCFYQNIMLTVDTIPNATYSWYRKTTPVDSVLLGTGLAYNLPFFEPEQIGQYVCKVNVNGGCITRMARFDLDGDCNNHVLPAHVELKGMKIRDANQLSWSNRSEGGVLEYVVERRKSLHEDFQAIATIKAERGIYYFNDSKFANGSSYYRVKLNYAGTSKYSNTVFLRSDADVVQVYPNPARSDVKIYLSSTKATTFKIEMVNQAGQLVWTSVVNNVESTTVDYHRTARTQPGVYMIRVTNTQSGKIEMRKVMFE